MKLKPAYLKNILLLPVLVVKTLFTKKGSARKALVTLRGLELKRPSTLVVRLLRLSGFSVFVSFDIIQYIKMGEYGRLLFKDKSVYLDMLPRPKYDLEIAHGSENGKKAQIFLQLDFNVFSRDAVKQGDLFFPILFHPNFLNEATIRHAEDLFGNRAKKDTPDIGVFFAGAFDQNTYNKRETSELFQIMTRYTILSIVQEAFRDTRLYIPKDLGQLFQDADEGLLREKIVVCDSATLRIPEDKWFEILSRSGFFLSPPGVLQPFCHNTIEAMSVGTVPILQYPEYFLPALQATENCLVFDSPETLLTLLESLFTDELKEKRHELSINAHAYYHNKLSVSAFYKALTEATNTKDQQHTLFICQNRLSTDLHKKRK